MVTSVLYFSRTATQERRPIDTQNQIAIIPVTATLSAIITASGPAAPERFLEFFAANIRNTNTRRAYARQIMQFLA